MANRKQLEFATTETGCIVPTSHKLNPDGYFRKRVRVDGKLQLKMYHVYVWEKENGPVPDGYEVDHICRNRACCNPKHLRALPGGLHAKLSNRNRNRGRLTAAYTYWRTTKCTGTELANYAGVTISCACRWIRKWKS